MSYDLSLWRAWRVMESGSVGFCKIDSRYCDLQVRILVASCNPPS
jgi:hypothetical protein